MRKIKNIVFRFLRLIVTIMLLVLSIVVFAQIISRYFFESPLVWSEELAILMMVWITFLGSVLILDKFEHISVDFLVNQFNERIQSIIFIIGYLLVLMLNIVFVIGGWEVIQTTKDSILPGMKISVGWLYGAIFIGGILSSIVLLEHLYTKLKNLYLNQKAGDNK
ncbi:hypothetical protein CIL05_17095 [Virgibacillus profundi]|uniref:Tripartite ATP-independent periplasmic transporters DctQ component domain-containing protein n=1 Tax=Virgibacillus profundi TaxID=2024555 RepID=A0A2A2I8L4_9BACI|nr:TRAP transporter small permease [Virgibacillus profundi]PAV28351.1 hypothetical protein CIL05_17095 [Virgibacillus profundi]PXY52287.1 TRAP transporter small permease [Virgibacillus profundi]